MGEFAARYNKEVWYENYKGKSKRLKDAGIKINKKFFCKALKTYGKVNCKKQKNKGYKG